jgi:glycerol uptake facilitator-like aquaporin
VAHLMFSAPLFAASRHARSGFAQTFSEFVATTGLLCVIWGGALGFAPLPFHSPLEHTLLRPIGSLPRHHPAVTLARSMTDTFAGIRPAGTPTFIAAQSLGAIAATALFRWLLPVPQMRPQTYSFRNMQSH